MTNLNTKKKKNGYISSSKTSSPKKLAKQFGPLIYSPTFIDYLLYRRNYKRKAKTRNTVTAFKELTVW